MALLVLHMRELRFSAEVLRKVIEEVIVAIGWPDVDTAATHARRIGKPWVSSPPFPRVIGGVPP